MPTCCAPTKGLFVVCDGMGGAPAGEVASQMAVDAILRELRDRATATSGPASGEQGFLPQTNRLAEVVRRSNEVIYDEAQKDPRQAGMGTTVVGAWISQARREHRARRRQPRVSVARPAPRAADPGSLARRSAHRRRT
jgi:protein phosphatase